MKLHNADCLHILKDMDDNSVHLILCDPPYQLSSQIKPRRNLENYDNGNGNPFARQQARKGFMGKEWDVLPTKEIWTECQRVLKPGGFMVCFSSTRMYHCIAADIEDCDFVVHPLIAYCFGSGMPKGHDVSKYIKKRREKNIYEYIKKIFGFLFRRTKKWEGYKYGLQTLKPALEIIGIFQKPWKGNQIDNILEYGTGVYNIKKCVIKCDIRSNICSLNKVSINAYGNGLNGSKNIGKTNKPRFPSNLILDAKTAKIMDQQSRELKSGDCKPEYIQKESENIAMSGKNYKRPMMDRQGDSSGASRYFQHCNFTRGDYESFFYTSKVSDIERNIGCDNLKPKPPKEKGGARTYNDRCGNCGNKFIGKVNICECDNPITDSTVFQQNNNHPTVKPISICLYLMRLFVSPIDKFVIVDPFMGSGTMGISSVLFDNVEYIGIEKEADYFEIAQARTKWAVENKQEIERCLDDDKCKVDINAIDKSAKDQMYMF